MPERPRLPPDIRSRLPRLADTFRDDPRVVAVYLFGSVARGTEGPLSDVDVAILLAEPIDPVDVSGRAVEYAAGVVGTLGTDEASVVMLNTAPLALRHRVIHDGRVILDRAPDRRRDFEVRSESLYLDFKPVLEAYDRELLRQLREPTA